MSDAGPVREWPLSCKWCDTAYDDAGLAADCTAEHEVVLDQTRRALYAERPSLWAERCGRCLGPVSSEQLAEHRRSWSLTRGVVPEPLCDECLDYLGLGVGADAMDVADDETGGERR